MAAGPPRIFDTDAYRARRARAVARGGDAFLADAAAKSIVERLAAVNRRFTNGIDFGSRDISAFKACADNWTMGDLAGGAPVPEDAFDLATSVLALHAENDLPGALIRIRRVLKPDGLFIAALFGGETLTELRQAFAAAEAETRGGVSPRVAPMADVRDLGGLLQRAGFALPVSDVERTVVRYRDVMMLFADLRSHGETNVLAGRSAQFLSRRTLAALTREYTARFAEPDGRVRATFDVVYLTGWAPHDSQQKPLMPGSAKSRLADALGTLEIPTGEKPN